VWQQGDSDAAEDGLEMRKERQAKEEKHEDQQVASFSKQCLSSPWSMQLSGPPKLQQCSSPCDHTDAEPWLTVGPQNSQASNQHASSINELQAAFSQSQECTAMVDVWSRWKMAECKKCQWKKV